MATINGISFQDPRNINLKGGAKGSGVIRFSPRTNWSSNPFSTVDYGLYINASGSLVYSSLGSTTVLGSGGGGGGGVPTWEAIFSSDSTFNVAGTTWTIDNSTGTNNVLTLTNSGAGSGHVVQITNVGTGKDINGTSNTWSVTKAGVAKFADIDTPLITSTAAITIAVAGANAITLGTGSNTITMAKATTFSSTIVVTDGLTSLISTSNSANALRVTNNTVTTYGVSGADTGVVVLRSTSLTTGSLLKLQLTESALTTGFYLNCYDVTGTTSVLTIGEDGAVVITGAGGLAVLTVTAGDVVLSDSSVAITDADNAASFSVTNNTATTASVIALAGSGVFTGVTTSSFLTLTASGLTTGTALYLVTAGLTTGKGIHVVGNALTTGALVRIESSSTGVTSGSLISLSTATTGAVATNGVVNIAGSGAHTSTAGVGLVNISDATATGNAVSIFTNALTTGSALLVSSSGTITSAGEGLVNLVASGLTAGSALKIDLTEGTVTSGLYLNCYDDTGTATVFSVGKAGATVIKGVASGTTALTLTAGNLLLSSGHMVMTAGNITQTDGSLIQTPQAIVNANTAINVTNGITTIANNAASTHTLADGTAGQQKTIACTVYTDDAVITPSNLEGGTTITLNAVGDTVTLVFLGTKWLPIATYGTTAIA